MIDDGIQTAEQLMHALFGMKRRLSYQVGVGLPLEPSLPSTKKRRLQNKSVRFSDDKYIHIVKRLESNDEYPQWYQDHEYAKIKEENHKTLIAFTKAQSEKDLLVDETEYCLRGLETQISILLLRMPYRNRQKKVVRSVLNLQQIQRNMKIHDEAALREMSLIVSNQDTKKALKNASLDRY